MNFYRRTSRTSHTHSNTPKPQFDLFTFYFVISNIPTLAGSLVSGYNPSMVKTESDGSLPAPLDVVNGFTA